MKESISNQISRLSYLAYGYVLNDAETYISWSQLKSAASRSSGRNSGRNSFISWRSSTFVKRNKVSRNLHAISKNSVVIWVFFCTQILRKDIIFGGHLKQVFGPFYFVSALSVLYCEERTESLKEYEQNSAT